MIYLYLWLLSGIITIILCFIQNYRNKLDITVSDLYSSFLLLILGPFSLIALIVMILNDNEIKDKIIIKFKK